MRSYGLPDPYEGFDISGFELDLQGWGSNDPVFYHLIANRKPSSIIEVGSWKGASAIHMASICKSLDLPTSIVCVDTWLGALEFWKNKEDPDRFLSLKLKNGYPQVYYTFLANVIISGHDNRITPFPQTSLIAARWFTEYNAKADMIYIDGSHDYPDVKADLAAYWPLVKRGGVMFGDDFDTWEGVRRAVEEFSGDKGILTLSGTRHWIMEKK